MLFVSYAFVFYNIINLKTKQFVLGRKKNCAPAAGPLFGPTRMRIRVRFPDGSTEKIEVEPSETVVRIVERLKSSESGTAIRDLSLFLSLNRKDSLSDDQTVASCGIRGGDLVFLISSKLDSGGTSLAASSSQHTAQARPSSNLFGLPGLAPGMVSGGASGTLGSGAAPTPTAAPASAPSRASATHSTSSNPPDPAAEREKRLRAIERRLGIPAAAPAAAEPAAAAPQAVAEPPPL